MNKKNSLVAFLSIVLIVACGGGGGAAPAPAPVPTPAPTPSPPTLKPISEMIDSECSEGHYLSTDINSYWRKNGRCTPCGVDDNLPDESGAKDNELNTYVEDEINLINGNADNSWNWAEGSASLEESTNKEERCIWRCNSPQFKSIGSLNDAETTKKIRIDENGSVINDDSYTSSSHLEAKGLKCEIIVY